MDFLRYLGRPTWVEVDLSSFASNVRELRRFLPGDVKMMAVVKADGYGHGAYELSRVAVQEGVSMLGVASLEEGLLLRRKGIDTPILILGYTNPRQSRILLENELTPTIFHWETALALSQKACALGKTADVHVKLDTGMGRLGLNNPGDVLHYLENVSRLPGIFLRGAYTHFATADEEDDSFALRQLRQFRKTVRICEGKGIKIPSKHAANSAAALRFPETHLDMVRVGISLYGYYPSGYVKRDDVKLTPVMSLKSRVVFIKKVAEGTPVSYGKTYLAPRETYIATVPLGYSDGYSRLLSNRGYMLVRGQEAPIAGRVCMDHVMLDVGKIQFIREGDEVVAFGRQGSEEISADYLAHLQGTISYEVLCNTGSRLPRVYLLHGKVINVVLPDKG